MYRYIIRVLLSFLIILPFELFGQKTGVVNIASDDPFAFRKAVCSFETIPLQITGSITESVIDYLKNDNKNFNSGAVSAKLTYDITSPGGRHLTFEQYYKGTLVYNTQSKITLDKANNIRFIADNSYNTSGWEQYGLSITAVQLSHSDISGPFLKAHPSAGVISKNEIAIAVINNQPAAYHLLETTNIDMGIHRQYLINATGNVIYDHDLSSYNNGSSIVPATASPFVPDPLTSAGVYYGAPYNWSPAGLSDASVIDGTPIANQRAKNDTIAVTIDTNSTYHLLNNVVGVEEFSSPTIAPPTSLTPSFIFAPSDPAFEDMNAFYNISVHNAHIVAIGFDSLANFFIHIDAHALNGVDNSQFLNNGDFRLYFGDGGVPDAQEADVVVHEYSHGVSFHASPGGNSGSERTALDEGQADYFATSYSRSLYEFRWPDMFTWDGHNEYWNGRIANSTVHYPQGISFGDIWTTGEMWSSSMMQIWPVLGRDTTDCLMLQALYSWAANISMTDAAQTVLQADALLYNGEHACFIAGVFENRGFIDSTTANTACKTAGIDQIQDISQQVKIVNTDGFAFNDEPAMVENIGLSPLKTVELIDVTGRTILVKQNLANSITYIESAGLLPGVYFIRVQTGTGTTTKKIVKVR